MAAYAAWPVTRTSTSLHSLSTPGRFYSGSLTEQRPEQEQHAVTSASLGGKGSSLGRLTRKFSKSFVPLQTSRASKKSDFSSSTQLIPSGETSLADTGLKIDHNTQVLYEAPSIVTEEVAASDDINRHPYAGLHVGDRWQEYHGVKNWKGLLSGEEIVIDPVLRGEIIRYGEFAQATYDAFEKDRTSKFCGSSKFDKESLLEEVGLLNRGYTITKFLYATAEAHLPKILKKSLVPDQEKWSKDSNFMGFVAVCTCPKELARLGRRDIVVAWRGTVTRLEWLENIRFRFSHINLDPLQRKSEVMVETGFLDLYTHSNSNSRYNKDSARDQVLSAIRELTQEYKDEEMSITVTGHSLGSALAMLCAYDIAESGTNKREHSKEVPKESRVPVSVFSYAGPRVGNSDFKERMESLGVNVLRMVEKHDLVPKVPGFLFSDKFQFSHDLSDWLLDSFVHVGRELSVNSLMSDYLRDTRDPIYAHNLEAYLHLLDGWQGPGARFSPAVNRDIALVNKSSDLLEPVFGIPENWWETRLMLLDKRTKRWIRAEIEDAQKGSLS